MNRILNLTLAGSFALLIVACLNQSYGLSTTSSVQLKSELSKVDILDTKLDTIRPATGSDSPLKAILDEFDMHCKVENTLLNKDESLNISMTLSNYSSAPLLINNPAPDIDFLLIDDKTGQQISPASPVQIGNMNTPLSRLELVVGMSDYKIFIDHKPLAADQTEILLKPHTSIVVQVIIEHAVYLEKSESKILKETKDFSAIPERYYLSAGITIHPAANPKLSLHSSFRSKIQIRNAR